MMICIRKVCWVWLHGIRKFDVTRGVRLSTYVYRWIQAYVQALLSQSLGLFVCLFMLSNRMVNLTNRLSTSLWVGTHPHWKKCVTWTRMQIVLSVHPVHTVTQQSSWWGRWTGWLRWVMTTHRMTMSLMCISFSLNSRASGPQGL